MQTRSGAIGLVFVVLLALLPARPASAATTWFVNIAVNDGLVAHWKLDEVGASTARDFVGAATATFTSTTTLTSTAPFPPVLFPDPGYAAFRDGKHAAIADTAALNLSTSFSVAFWARRVITNGSATIYNSGTQANHWYVGFHGNNGKFAFTERTIADFDSNLSITNTRWNHFAVTKNGDDAGNLRIYINGALDSTYSVITVTVPSGPKRIGNLTTGANVPFTGDLDDLRVYNRALTPVEVIRLSRGSGCPTSGQEWETAFPELQCALEESDPGDEIWVAKGDYRPGVARLTSFTVGKNLSIRGGFAGVEASPAERPPFDPFAPLTVLTGDIDRNDNPATFANYGENSTNVVVVESSVSAAFDRLSIRGGNALGAATAALVNGAGIHAKANAILSLTEAVIFANRTDLTDNGSGAGIYAETGSTSTLSATTVLSNSSGGSFGGGAYLKGAATVTNSHFEGNRVTLNGFGYGGGIATDGPAVVATSVFTGNQAGASGGGVSHGFFSLDPISIFSSTFAQNAARSGGGVNLFQGGTVTASTFLSNTAEAGGGALATGNGTPLRVDSVTLQNNRATGMNCMLGCILGHGGAIEALGPLTVSATTMFSNSAFSRGGAIFSSDSAVIESSSIVSHSALARGGAIESSGPLQVVDSTIGEGVASNGGGIAATSRVTLSNTSLISNTSRTMGGGAVVTGTLVMTGGLVSGNQTGFSSFDPSTPPSGAGAGIAVSGTTTISGTQFINNVGIARESFGLFSNVAVGGGLSAHGQSTVTNSQFLGNQSGTGGGIEFTGVLTAGRNDFTDNGAEAGAGIGGSGVLTATANQFLRNRAASTATGGIGRGGGLMVFTGTAVSALNSLFVDNTVSGFSAAIGNHADVSAQTTLFANNTVSETAANGNSALSFGSGNATIRNSIVAGTSIGIAKFADGTATEGFNLFFANGINSSSNVTPTGGSLTANPQFVDPAAGNLRLQSTSPGIDSGDNGALPAGTTTDLDGNPRLVDVLLVPDTGVGGPPTIDRGAYEAAAGPAPSPTPTPTSTPTSTPTVTPTPTATSTPGGPTLTPTPQPTNTPVPAAANTPVPLPTSTPTATAGSPAFRDNFVPLTGRRANLS